MAYPVSALQDIMSNLLKCFSLNHKVRRLSYINLAFRSVS